MFEHMKSEDQRKELMKKLCDKWLSAYTSELVTKDAPTIKEFLAFVSALPMPDETCDD